MLAEFLLRHKIDEMLLRIMGNVRRKSKPERFG